MYVGGTWVGIRSISSPLPALSILPKTADALGRGKSLTVFRRKSDLSGSEKSSFSSGAKWEHWWCIRSICPGGRFVNTWRCNQLIRGEGYLPSNPTELPLNIAPLSFRHPTHICCSFSTSKCKSSARKERNPALFTAHKSEAVRMVCPGKMLDLRHVDRISASGCQRERARAASDRTFRRKQPSPAPLHLFSPGP